MGAAISGCGRRHLGFVAAAITGCEGRHCRYVANRFCGHHSNVAENWKTQRRPLSTIRRSSVHGNGTPRPLRTKFPRTQETTAMLLTGFHVPCVQSDLTYDALHVNVSSVAPHYVTTSFSPACRHGARVPLWREVTHDVKLQKSANSLCRRQISRMPASCLANMIAGYAFSVTD